MTKQNNLLEEQQLDNLKLFIKKLKVNIESSKPTSLTGLCALCNVDKNLSKILLDEKIIHIKNKVSNLKVFGHEYSEAFSIKTTTNQKMIDFYGPKGLLSLLRDKRKKKSENIEIAPILDSVITSEYEHVEIAKEISKTIDSSIHLHKDYKSGDLKKLEETKAEEEISSLFQDALNDSIEETIKYIKDKEEIIELHKKLYDNVKKYNDFCLINGFSREQLILSRESYQKLYHDANEFLEISKKETSDAILSLENVISSLEKKIHTQGSDLEYLTKSEKTQRNLVEELTLKLKHAKHGKISFTNRLIYLFTNSLTSLQK